MLKLMMQIKVRPMISQRWLKITVKKMTFMKRLVTQNKNLKVAKEITNYMSKHIIFQMTNCAYLKFL